MDDIDESTDSIGASASASASASAGARALFLSSSTSAGIMAGEGQASQQASYPAPNTTFVIRSSGNGSSTTVVPVTSAAVIQSSPT